MKATIKTKPLTEALSHMKLVCGTRTTLPVLTCVRMLVEDGEMKLSATNLDTFLSITVPAESTEPGECVVACNRLLDGVKYAGESVELSVEKEHLVIKFDDSAMRLRTLKPEEFPKWPETVGGKSVPVPFAALLAIMRRVLPFASKQHDSRPVLQGAFVTSAKGGANVVGCDGRRMIVIHSDAIKEWPSDTIISTDLSRLLFSLEKDDEGDALVQFTEGYFCATGSEWRIASRLMADPYPNWRHVIPDSSRAKTKITVNRAALLRAVQIAAITVNPKIGSITLEAAGRELTVKSQDADSDSSASALPAKIGGDKITVGFNPWFLADMIEACSGEDFTLQIESNVCPALVEEEGLKLVLSPFRVQ